MSAFTLSTAQDGVAALLEANALRNGSLLAGIPVIRHKYGQPDTDPLIRAAIGEGGPGFCLLLTQPEVDRLSDEGNGVARISIKIPVFLFENREQNSNGATGLKRDPMQVIEALWSAACKHSGHPNFVPGPSMNLFIGDVGATYVHQVDFEFHTIFQPAP